jgi:hypothetical protein
MPATARANANPAAPNLGIAAENDRDLLTNASNVIDVILRYEVLFADACDYELAPVG